MAEPIVAPAEREAGKERHPVTSRVLRGLSLYSEHAEDIVDVGDGFWLVPSSAGSGEDSYLVDLEIETCECPDHLNRGSVCKHIVASMIASAKAGNTTESKPAPAICDKPDCDKCHGRGKVFPDPTDLTEEAVCWSCMGTGRTKYAPTSRIVRDNATISANLERMGA